MKSQKPLFTLFLLLPSLLLILPLFCWAQKIAAGVYVEQKYKESYIELRPDGTFYLSNPQRWGNANGQYRTQNSNLVLVVETWQGTTLTFKVTRKSLISEDQQKWVLWSGGKTRKEYARKNSLWLAIPAGHTEDGFSLTKDAIVLLDGKRFGEFPFYDPEAAELLLSPASPQNKYILCLFIDRDKGGVGGALIDIKNRKKLLDLHASMKWVSWSPQDKYALVATYYEADMSLSRIDLQRMEETRIPINLAKQGEEQNFDLDNLRWTNAQTFSFPVTINCNPYTDPNCTDENRKKVLRSYDVQVSAATLALSYKKTQ